MSVWVGLCVGVGVCVSGCVCVCVCVCVYVCCVLQPKIEIGCVGKKEKKRKQEQTESGQALNYGFFIYI